MDLPKCENFRLSAPYVYEDGTWKDLCEVVLIHPQQDPAVIARSAEEISKYINFCMECSSDYWSPERGAYVHIPKKGEQIDYGNQRFSFHKGFSRWHEYDGIRIDERADNEELETLLQMAREVSRMRSNPTDADKERKEKYRKGGYGFLLSLMLDGKFFFKE